MGSTQLLSVPYALYAKESGNGPTGAPGHNSLIQSIVEPAGANCTNGGYFVQSWLDLDDDGALSVGETSVDYYICNGADGANGTNGADGADGVNGTNGADGSDGVGITSTVDNGDGTFTINYSDATSFTTTDLTGAAGADGIDGVNGTVYTEGTGISLLGDSITNLGDADADASNELQVISISNDTIFLSNGGNYVILPTNSADTDWTQGGGAVYNNTDFVGIGTSTPFFALDVVSSDTVVAAFRGNNPNFSAVSISNTNATSDVGFILLAGADTAIFGLNPTQKLLVLDNSIAGGHIALNADSSVVSYAEAIGNVANTRVFNFTEVIYNEADTIFNYSPSGNIVNVNNGSFYTDSLHVLGNNAFNLNWILANNGLGQAIWKDPTTLGLGGSLWQSNSPDIFFNTGKVGIGTATPSSALTINTSTGGELEFVGGFNADISAPSQLNISSNGATLVDASEVYLRTNSTDRVTILNNGNVGIGLINPAVELDVNGETQSNDVRVLNNFIYNSLGNTGAKYVLMDDGAGTGKAVWQHPDSLGIAGGAFNSNGGNTVLNNIGDKVGMGTITPGGKLHVSGGAAGEPVALFDKGGFLPATIDINHTGSSGSGINFQNGGTVTSSISSSMSNVLTLTSQNVEVGNTPKTGKLNVASTSSVASPTLLLHETSTGYSRIKHTNTVTGGKYWITEAGINTIDANSGYSIAYNDGANTKIPFIIYGDNKVGINNLNAPLGIFHVMDNNGSYSIFEGMNQPGEIKITRSNQPSFTRQAILGGEDIGNVTFAGAIGTTFGSGPQISARATENFSGTNNGSELIFKTIANGSNTHQDALRLLNDGTVEIPTNLRILNGSGTAGQVLTSDLAGNATWQNPGSGADDWGTQVVQVDGTTITGDGDTTPLSGFDGDYGSLSNTPTIPANTSDLTNDSGFITNANDADSDPNNEIELPATASTNDVLIWNGSAWVAGMSPADGDGNSTNEIQNLSNTTAGNNVTVNISGGTGTTFSVNDADANSTNEIQTLSFTNPNLTLSNGGGSVDLSGLSSTTYWDPSGTDIYSNNTGNVGIGITPSNKLDVSGDIHTNATYKLDGSIFIDNRATSTLIGATGNAVMTGVYNTLVGQFAGQQITSGMRNTIMGRNAGSALTTETDNTLIGLGAGQNIAGGSENTMLGSYAGWSLTNTGGGNTYIGAHSGHDNTSGSNNVFLGLATGYSITTGSNNTFLGYWSGRNNLTGTGNVFLGAYAGQNETGSNHLYIDNSNTATPLVWGDFFTNELKINGSLNINNAYTFPTVDGGASGLALMTDGAGNVSWGTPSVSTIWGQNGSEIHYNSGNVGIGNSDPVHLFHIQDSLASAGTVLFRLENNIGTQILNIDNDGNINAYGNLQVANGSQAAGHVLTSIDANGNTMWKPKNIAFEVGVPGGINVSGAPILLQFDQIVFNDGGYSTAINGFEPPVDGVYALDVNVMFELPTTGPEQGIVELWIGGVKYKTAQVMIGNGSQASAHLSITTKLTNGSDDVRVVVYSGGQTLNIVNDVSTWFSGHLVYAY